MMSAHIFLICKNKKGSHRAFTTRGRSTFVGGGCRVAREYNVGIMCVLCAALRVLKFKVIFIAKDANAHEPNLN